MSNSLAVRADMLHENAATVRSRLPDPNAAATHRSGAQRYSPSLKATPAPIVVCLQL
jgi:hypothetical protein